MASCLTPGEPLDREPYTYPAEPSVEEQFADWRCALLDILCEHYNPAAEFTSCNGETAEWKLDLAAPATELNDWIEEQLVVTGNRKDAFALKSLQSRYASLLEPPVPHSAFMEKAISYLQNRRGRIAYKYKGDKVDGKSVVHCVRGALLKPV